MKRRISIWLLIICGMVLVGAGLDISRNGLSVRAQADNAKYVGARECRSCHRDITRDHAETLHALALQAADRDTILADFDQGEAERTVLFPGDSEARPFTARDIAYVIGAGRYAQRYLVELNKDEYAVLPAEWNTVTQAWQPLELADEWPAPAYDWLQSCAGCHTTGLNVERGRWQDDGVQCEACHGPGSVHVDLADRAGRRASQEQLAAIHAAIVLSPDAQICGQCHSRGVEPEAGRLYPVNYRPGADLLHADVFALAATDDTTAWWETGHAHQNNMQFNEWLTSAHATSLDTLKSSSAAQDGCLQCHGSDYTLRERIARLYGDDGERAGEPPAPVTLDTAQFSVTCITCHSPHHAEQADFLLAADTYSLCTACHQNTELTPTLHHPVMEMFEGRAVIESVAGIPAAHFADENGPRCVTCHMPEVPIAGGLTLAAHTWRPVLPGAAANSPPDSCSGCHQDLTTTDLHALVRETQAAVRSRLSTAWARVASVNQDALTDDTSAMYAQVITALTFVQNDGSQGVHNYRYTDALLNTASGLLTQISVPGARLEPTEAPAPTATVSGVPVSTAAEAAPVRSGARPMTFIILGAAALTLLVGAFVYFRPARRREA